MTGRIPSESECFALLSEMDLSPALVRHSIGVKDFALELASRIEAEGHAVDKGLVAASALLHDVFKLQADFCHGIEGGAFLREKGFYPVASVVEKHCLGNLSNPSFVPMTAEEKILLYSDLRVGSNGVVSLDDRFDSIRKRYGLRPQIFEQYMKFAKGLEDEFRGLLKDGKGLL